MLIAILAYSLAFQGSRPLAEPDEGRYTAVALQMLKSGDWMTPRLHPDVPHFTKPPLTYWALASSFGVFGHSELAARLPNALAFVATTLLVLAIARALGERQPGLAPVIYATTLLPYAAANIVTTDTLLTLWETLAAWGFVKAMLMDRGGVRRRFLTVMWLGLALAFLTKGPVGLLPLAAFVVCAWLRGGAHRTRQMVTLPGLVVFGVLGLGWYLAMVATRPELLGYFVGYETVGRMIGDAHGRNPEWYGALKVYLPVILLGGMPWIGFVIPARRRLAAQLRTMLRGWRSWEHRSSLLLGLWIFLPLIVLCLVRSRMHLYLLPLSVPFALLVARSLHDANLSRQKVAMIAVLSILALVGLRFAASRIARIETSETLAEAVHRMMIEPPSEVVLVNRLNGYGLTFYLGTDVEHVVLHADDPLLDRGDFVETVAQEVTDQADLDEGGRLFLVPHWLAPRFEATVGQLPGPVIPIGSWYDNGLYWLEGSPPQTRAAASRPFDRRTVDAGRRSPG